MYVEKSDYHTTHGAIKWWNGWQTHVSWGSGSVSRDSKLGQVDFKTITENLFFLSPHDFLQIVSLFSATLPLTQIIHVGILAYCYILQIGFFLNSVFSLPPINALDVLLRFSNSLAFISYYLKMIEYYSVWVLF